MTAYTTLLDAVFAVGSAIRGSTGKALRDNLAAVTEGDSTAPRIAAKAVRGFDLIDLSGTGSVEVDVTGIGGGVIMYIGSVGGGSANDEMIIETSDDGGATWSSQTKVGFSAVSWSFLSFTTSSGLFVGTDDGNGAYVEVTKTPNFDAIRLRPEDGAAFSPRYVQIQAWAAES